MKGNSRISIGSPKGFTLIELLVVVIIISTIVTMATPAFVNWRENLRYRSAAVSAVSILRQAKNLAITTNLEQQVVFNSTGFGIQSGNRANNTQASGWGPITNGTTVPSTVTMSALTIQFAPNGTAPSNGTVWVQDSLGTARFSVTVSQVGRISVMKVD